MTHTVECTRCGGAEMIGRRDLLPGQVVIQLCPDCHPPMVVTADQLVAGYRTFDEIFAAQ